jgi:alpha-mannosidase
VIEYAQKELTNAMKKAVSKVRFLREGIPIAVFNSLSWERSEPISFKIPENLRNKPIIVKDRNGVQKPIQVTDGQATLIAETPPMGYTTYYLTQGKANSDGNGISLAPKEDTLENEFLRVEIEKESGAIKELYDKKNKRLVFKKDPGDWTMPVSSNLFQVLYEAPHDMSAWVIGEITRVDNLTRGTQTRMIEKGPVRGVIRSERHVGNSTIVQDIMIYRDVRRIDFQTHVDWEEIADEKHDAPMLRVSFSPLLNNPKATFEIPFGAMERAADGREVPALRWVDLSDDEYGVSILNDSKHGFSAQGNNLRMTLIRTAYDPDPISDKGHHEMSYSIYPHEKDWREGMAFRKAIEFNYPLQVFLVENPVSGTYPDEYSYLEIKPENIILSALKVAEDSNNVILRLYEATGKESVAEINLNSEIRQAYEVDLMEENQENLTHNRNSVSLHFMPFEIKTIELVTDRP